MFSLSLYEDDMDLRSACSYSSESDDLRFDVDLDVHVAGEPEYLMRLPSSLPSNADLEADIATCFERASMQPTTTTTSSYDDLALANPDAPIEMVLFDDQFDPGGTRTTGSFRQAEVVLWGWWWWETGE